MRKTAIGSSHIVINWYEFAYYYSATHTHFILAQLERIKNKHNKKATTTTNLKSIEYKLRALAICKSCLIVGINDLRMHYTKNHLSEAEVRWLFKSFFFIVIVLQLPLHCVHCLSVLRRGLPFSFSLCSCRRLVVHSWPELLSCLVAACISLTNVERRHRATITTTSIVAKPIKTCLRWVQSPSSGATGWCYMGGRSVCMCAHMCVCSYSKPAMRAKNKSKQNTEKTVQQTKTPAELRL